MSDNELLCRVLYTNILKFAFANITKTLMSVIR
jgi:hypothetical protein